MSKNGKSREKPSTTVPATVQKVIKPYYTHQPEKAQIALDEGEDLYREIRVENSLQDEQGHEVRLKPGVPVEITIAADEEDTVKKTED